MAHIRVPHDHRCRQDDCPRQDEPVEVLHMPDDGYLMAKWVECEGCGQVMIPDGDEPGADGLPRGAPLVAS